MEIKLINPTAEKFRSTASKDISDRVIAYAHLIWTIGYPPWYVQATALK